MSTAYYTDNGRMLGQISSLGKGRGSIWTDKGDAVTMESLLHHTRKVVDEHGRNYTVAEFRAIINACSAREDGGDIE